MSNTSNRNSIALKCGKHEYDVIKLDAIVCVSKRLIRDVYEYRIYTTISEHPMVVRCSEPCNVFDEMAEYAYETIEIDHSLRLSSPYAPKELEVDNA